MLKVAICENDLFLCTDLEKNIIQIGKGCFKKVEVQIFYSGETLLKSLDDGDLFDLIFLDIELGDLSGIEVGKIIRDELRDESTALVYISTKESHAMKLFDTRPLNFLIKPISYTKLKNVVETACRLLSLSNAYFEYTVGYVSYKTPIKDILYFESFEKKVKIVLWNREIFFYARLKDIDTQMSQNGFLSIHKSYLVNQMHIIEYQYTQVMMANHAVLPISQKNRSYIRSLLLRTKKIEISC